MKQPTNNQAPAGARIYVITETREGTPYVWGAALTEDNAVIFADKLADYYVNLGRVPKVTNTKTDLRPTEPREIRRYEFKPRPGFPAVQISVLEMEPITNPDY